MVVKVEVMKFFYHLQQVVMVVLPPAGVEVAPLVLRAHSVKEPVVLREPLWVKEPAALRELNVVQEGQRVIPEQLVVIPELPVVMEE